jgi:hypothetical protein
MVVTMIPLALMVTVFSLLASARIVGNTAGYIDVIGLFVRRRIPIADIVDVHSDGGLKIRMASGRSIGSIAYGQSLVGNMIGYPRSKKAAVRIKDFCESTRALGGGCDELRYSAKLRVEEILIALGLASLMITVTVILNHR